MIGYSAGIVGLQGEMDSTSDNDASVSKPAGDSFFREHDDDTHLATNQAEGM